MDYKSEQRWLKVGNIICAPFFLLGTIHDLYLKLRYPEPKPQLESKEDSNK